jgi:hypothetical protein
MKMFISDLLSTQKNIDNNNNKMRMIWLAGGPQKTYAVSEPEPDPKVLKVN